MASRRFQWEAQEHLAVPFNSTPLINLPILSFLNLYYLASSEEEDGDDQKVNIQRKQNCWVRQLRSSRAVIIPKKPSLSPGCFFTWCIHNKWRLISPSLPPQIVAFSKTALSSRDPEKITMADSCPLQEVWNWMIFNPFYDSMILWAFCWTTPRTSP